MCFIELGDKYKNRKSKKSQGKKSPYRGGEPLGNSSLGQQQSISQAVTCQYMNMTASQRMAPIPLDLRANLEDATPEHGRYRANMGNDLPAHHLSDTFYLRQL